MHIDNFDYPLPPDLIAQEPAAERDQSRLLVVQRHGPVLAQRRFLDLPEYLRPGDLLVLNDTRVLPARLYGLRERTGGKWEGLFITEHADGTWEMLGQTRGRLTVGETIRIKAESEKDPLTLRMLKKSHSGSWRVAPDAKGPAAELLQRYGHLPLPPYIRKGHASESDSERYQTVFARQPGAVAAPTAGLHFTPRLFEMLKQQGVLTTTVTLHVGPGTFQPVQVEEISEHRVQAERVEVSASTVAAINECKARGGRVIAVGTTTVRSLESAARSGELRPFAGLTDLTVCPPFSFRVVDALITNFHLPRSSLLLLVAAFTGLESLRAAYATAIEQRFRFYSYGDAMLIT